MVGIHVTYLNQGSMWTLPILHRFRTFLLIKSLFTSSSLRTLPQSSSYCSASTYSITLPYFLHSIYNCLKHQLLHVYCKINCYKVEMFSSVEHCTEHLVDAQNVLVEWMDSQRSPTFWKRIQRGHDNIHETQMCHKLG